MTSNKIAPSFTERSFIKKYTEGVDPNTGSPFEIVEGPTKRYEGQAAIDRLHELGYKEEIVCQ